MTVAARGDPHQGKLDYISPTLNQSTGTLAVSGVFSNPDHACCRALTFASACPLSRTARY